MIEIAIDGTAASGKGTLGKKLSDKYSFPYLDTGMLYRKVAYELIKGNKFATTKLEQTSCDFAMILSFRELNSLNLRTEKVTKLASKIATFPNLRKILNDKQRKFNNLNKKKFGGCILDGRDIGTTILPNADFKFFITASLKVRAKRRLLEKNISFLHENDEKCMLQNLMNSMRDRDKLDSKRKISPLRPAKDAYVIDTTLIDPEELLFMVTNIIENKT
ncbi:(d)CMP kinase [Alphaproteobacteria bacterium]|nr:(d)CMP kinase [Alphaproteobacteria bacterium]